MKNQLFVFAFILLLAVFGYRGWQTYGPSLLNATPQVQSQATPAIVSKFSLTDHRGKPVTEKTYAGRYSLVFFGYTYCPDVCPTILQDMTTTLELLGDDAKRIAPLFISVDPERDTVELLKEYMSNFHPSIVGLTGTSAAITAVGQSFKVYFAKEVPEGAAANEYLYSHSARIYMMGPAGEYVTSFQFGTAPEEIARKIQDFI